ncbi:hypothetical protein SRHO_G00305590 [Serrasalmus rhombeus]
MCPPSISPSPVHLGAELTPAAGPRGPSGHAVSVSLSPPSDRIHELLDTPETGQLVLGGIRREVVGEKKADVFSRQAGSIVWVNEAPAGCLRPGCCQGASGNLQLRDPDPTRTKGCQNAWTGPFIM